MEATIIYKSTRLSLSSKSNRETAIDVDTSHTTTGDNRTCLHTYDYLLCFQTLTHVFHSSKQIPLSVHRHQLSTELPGGYG